MAYTLNYEAVKSYIEERKITEAEFCNKVKIATSDLEKLKSDDHSISFNALEKIASFLDISIMNLFKYESQSKNKLVYLK